ncbi:MAG: flagellar motor protein MotB [Butyrivibrio sp.]|nr:flagellar motor protein MotB [Butyrivibrio sp.]
MAKKEPPPPKGSPAWMATFGDLMNLLLCFFVLLYAMSSVDAAKFEEIAASFSSAFGIFKGGEMSIGEGALVGDGISQLSQVSSYVTSMGVSQNGSTTTEVTTTTGNKDSESTGGEGESATEYTESGNVSDISSDNTESGSDGTTSTQQSSSVSNASAEELMEALEEEQLGESENMAEQIAEALNEAEIEQDVELNFTSQYVQLTIQGAILFDSGYADIRSEAIPILEKVGAILERYAGGTIEIEGHTDNVPMSSGKKYANNDELSDARALSVFYFMIENTTLDPANIKHSGRGEYSPVADNSTPEGRAKNRRVEIRIYNPLSSQY